MLRDIINFEALKKNNDFMKTFMRKFLLDRIDEYKSSVKYNDKHYSPVMTGTPTAPTASAGTNTTQVATTEFVQNAIGDASYSIKEEVLSEIPEIPEEVYIEDGHNDGDITVNGSSIYVGGLHSMAFEYKEDYVKSYDGELSGTPTAPTAEFGTNSEQIATTAFVQNTVSRYIPGVGGEVNIDHDYVVEMNKDIPTGSWYRLYKSGWLEQCAVINCAGDSTNTFTFLKEFETTNYFFNTGIYCDNGTFNQGQPIWLTARTTKGGTLHWDMWAGTAYVFACGQAANVDTTTVSDLRETIATKAYVDAAIAAITGTEDVNEEEF